jgi:cysteine synthase A
MLQLAGKMVAEGRRGAIVTLLCDSGERYLDTYYNPDWVKNHIGDVTPYLQQLNEGHPFS